MLKLPKDIQSLFSASTQISSYKRTVEELVYNSLDADSTSIAIRVNIEDQTIQVIDNGLGISKTNFELLGQRYATSKCVDMSTLKSAPNKYGYRGQSLASIIEVSEKVHITSRCDESEETWEKCFSNGKKQKLTETAQRPSKGTTVEIKGFLHNLKIQRNAVDELNELNDIKIFLEQLSLVHNNISLSLRNDSKNEIIFKLHKNRDIYQTLSSVFEIKEKELQEITVQKNEYKVTAYIGKKDVQKTPRNWIYLNRKILHNSKIHKIVNDNFLRMLKLNFQTKRKVKTKIFDKEEEKINYNGIPFYFIFITCPYYDYDITHTSKKTTVEFKNWEQINKLIERLAKVYTGDTVNLKEIKPIQNKTKPVEKTSESREQVKKIMEKILGSNPRKPGVSQMQNGVKGKLVKRKRKTNDKKIPKLKLSKIIKETIPKEDNVKNVAVESNNHISLPPATTNINKDENQKEVEKVTKNDEPKKDKITIKPVVKTSKYSKKVKRTVKETKIDTLHKHHNRKIDNSKNGTKGVPCLKQKNKVPKQVNKQNREKKPQEKRDKVKTVKVDPLLKHFQEDPTGSIKQRCEILNKNIDGLISYNRQPKRKIFVNETVQYSNIVRNNKNYSVRKKIGEIVIHEYVPKPPQSSSLSFDGRNWNNVTKNPCKTSYDLIRTILRTQEITEEKNSNSSFAKCDDPGESVFTQTYAYNKRKSKYTTQDQSRKNNLPRLTYNSHNYNTTEINEGIAIDDETPQKKARKFISTHSKDNFVVPHIQEKLKRKKHKDASNFLKMFSDRFENFNESRFNIDFTQSNDDASRQSRSDETSSLLKYDISRYDQENFNKENNDQRSFSQFGYTFSNHVSRAFHRHYCENDQVSRRNEDNIEYSPHLTSMENVLQNLQENGTYTIEKNDFGRLDYTYTLSDQRINLSSQRNQFNENVQNVTASDDVISNTLDINKIASMENITKDKKICEIDRSNNMNVVFISNSQEQAVNNDSPLLSFNPVNICETYNDNVNNGGGEFEERKNQSRICNDSLFNEDFDIDSFLCDRNAHNQNFNSMATNELLDEFNVNFKQNTDENILAENVTNYFNQNNENINVNMSEAANKHGNDKLSVKIKMNADSNFNFRNRLRFLPKGMSQIFENCQSKKLCDNDRSLDEEYYEKTIYNDFANVVNMNTEVFEPNVQNVHELNTKAIEKVNNRLNKDSASLIFNGQTLKKAKVLGQIDDKFIAAKVLGRTQDSTEMSEYLVLFDQHAIHERIRLENNLADYLKGEQWKSITLDEITIKLSKDEILYLHNYKDKFIQLGLQWSILNNGEVSLTSIPEAILGKNPRQVEVVMKSVKSLITEEINAIRTQSGCISLYPKSIMDLVFSEACRYAIKFGDKLSKAECIDLLNSLSECKTPFQCAHGRPVMAVLMDVNNKKSCYKVNLSKVLKWKK